MAFHFHSGWRSVAWLAFLVIPGFVAAYLLRSNGWIAVIPLGLVVLILAFASFAIKRKVTPQQWADELEKHLLGMDGAWGWDDATSVALADERLERLRGRLIAHFDRLDTPEKCEEFKEIIEALKRGDVP